MAGVIPVSFTGGEIGEWRVVTMDAIRGEPLPPVSNLAVHPRHVSLSPPASWVLHGTKNHVRYTERQEQVTLDAKQEGLGRPSATCAALIPIRKSEAWWGMTQEERRAIFEEQSGHIAKSIAYLPAIARRLYHCRDLGEPFDFLTWFEYAPEHGEAFDALVATLRTSREWDFVEAEVDIRLVLS